MGLLTGLVLLPLAPLRATVWIAEKLAQYASTELGDERAVRRMLLEAQIAHESGELSDREHELVEDELLVRLEELQSERTAGVA
jgi:gas vesicle protein GvpG